LDPKMIALHRDGSLSCNFPCSFLSIICQDSAFLRMH
jgi:hypothetical protein